MIVDDEVMMMMIVIMMMMMMVVMVVVIVSLLYAYKAPHHAVRKYIHIQTHTQTHAPFAGLP
jgi:uncharacterized membrane protein